MDTWADRVAGTAGGMEADTAEDRVAGRAEDKAEDKAEGTGAGMPDGRGPTYPREAIPGNKAYYGQASWAACTRHSCIDEP